MKHTMSTTKAKSKSQMFLDELEVGATGSMIVMVCWIWNVNVVSGRYLSTDFVISDAKPNKDVLRIFKDAPFIVEFDGETSVRKAFVKFDGFIRYPFELVELKNLELTHNKHMIDVVGYVTNVGRIVQQRSGSRTLDFYLANSRGHAVRVTLWGGLGEKLIEKRTRHVGLYPIVLTSLSVKLYNSEYPWPLKYFQDFLIPLMEISIADQIALDDALVAPANRLKIGKCNLRLSSDVTSKEATLQVVYDVLKLTPFYKAFQVFADVPEIYMQEFWASAYIHNRSVRFKMNNKKHILNLDQFRDILQIFPKVGNKKFEEPPLEKEILRIQAQSCHDKRK
ncbi:zinc finger, CCHC-type containing protein [Tanacetum coccineum]|uniref:Zinc finger, CCHC-type containing protein n=1 Tax=Tanacetum coccineum TaxID=301880 RepID=A0ABQ5FYE7_9ASTR